MITGEDEGYDEARAVHNGMFDKRPLAVLEAEQVGDVIAAVRSRGSTGLTSPCAAACTADLGSGRTMAAW